MKNDNNRPQPLVHLTNRILAVVDDAESADSFAACSGDRRKATICGTMLPNWRRVAM